MPAILYLVLKFKWFDQVKSGEKKFDYRLFNSYWKARFHHHQYKRLVLMRGYTKTRIELPWQGYEIKTITHEEWDNVPTKVFAIRL